MSSKETNHLITSEKRRMMIEMLRKANYKPSDDSSDISNVDLSNDEIAEIAPKVVERKKISSQTFTRVNRNSKAIKRGSNSKLMVNPKSSCLRDSSMEEDNYDSVGEAGILDNISCLGSPNTVDSFSSMFDVSDFPVLPKSKPSSPSKNTKPGALSPMDIDIPKFTPIKRTSPNGYSSSSSHCDNFTERACEPDLTSVKETVQPSPKTLTDSKPRVFKPPPIIINDIPDFHALKKDIVRVCGNNFNVKNLPNNSIRVNCLTSDAYRALTKFLNGIPKLSWHSWQLKEDRGFRCVVRGLYHATEKQELVEAFAIHGHKVRSSTVVVDRITKKPFNLFFVELEPASNNKLVFDITRLCYEIVKIEAPREKPSIPQCYRCLDYGHTQSYCHKVHRCVKCGLNHKSIECTKARDSPAKCALCGNDHTANWKGCSEYKKVEARYTSNLVKSITVAPVSVSNVTKEVSFAEVAGNSSQNPSVNPRAHVSSVSPPQASLSVLKPGLRHANIKPRKSLTPAQDHLVEYKKALAEQAKEALQYPNLTNHMDFLESHSSSNEQQIAVSPDLQNICRRLEHLDTQLNDLVNWRLSISLVISSLEASMAKLVNLLSSRPGVSHVQLSQNE